ncbi:extracellular solute-binding protein [Blastopirellula sp. JC732]|uniref:Extracellular solute-binding protein n=1 Tax=Blastopirellula sediminis TaxID=2894196 RepID=A0A9X1MLD4_9BACT|nr:extracellular solute-binding protein [Blastopirellula sediminis]MCC9608873.1 extracellular solute-binding protein [Blastopirellula sediminis]MCC9628350.1 extracellular solute-binding protein [Blastopirellula sediminis]
MSRYCCFALSLITLVFTLGCPQPKPPVVEEKRPSGPFKLLVLDDPQLADAIEREWQAREERPLELTKSTAAELLKGEKVDADAVIYPPQLLGELIAREWIEPLPESLQDNEALDLNDIFPAVRRMELDWGGKTYGVPFGSQTLVLMYRPEVFEKLELEVPTTWVEYQSAVDRIASSEFCTGDAPKFVSATLEPLAAQWRSKLFLARSAAYAKNPSNYAVLFGLSSADALIGQQSFVKGAEELKAVAETIPADLQALSPAEVGRQFLAGKSAMAIGWLSLKSQENEAKLEFTPDFAPLPGSAKYWNELTETWEERRGGRPAEVPFLTISGRIGSVSRSSRSARDAALGLILLSASDSAVQVSPASEATTVYRNTNVGGITQWIDPRLTSEGASTYGEAVALTLSSSEAINLNLPGVEQYLAALDVAVGKILESDATPQETLQKTAQEWNDITDKIGRPAQIKANSASLGR